MHIEKFNRVQTLQTQGHLFNRDRVKSNINVNIELSKNNIIYKNFNLNEYNNRLDEIYIYGKNGGHKDDIIYSFGIIINKPNDCDVDDKTFYDSTYDILKNMFGEKNIISCVVHNDEEIKKNDDSIIRSHMHCEIIPVVFDKKNKREKLCAKELLNKSFFQNFHDVIETELLNYGIIAKMHDETQKTEYINDIKKYKEKKLKQDIQELEQKINEVKDKEDELDVAEQYLNDQIERRYNMTDNLDDIIKNASNDDKEKLENYKKTVSLYINGLEQTLNNDDGSEFYNAIRQCLDYFKNLLLSLGLIKIKNKNIDKGEER